MSKAANPRFTSVWDAIEDSPQQAASMKARAALMMELEAYIRKAGLTQAQAAKVFKVTQPRVSNLVRGKIELFSLDTLVEMAAAAGLSPLIRLKMPKSLVQKSLQAA